jgi:F-type H+-transporting ATPase subunit delta
VSYAEALSSLVGAIAADRNLGEFLSDPLVPKDKRASIIASSLGPDAKGPGPEVFGRFCSLIVEKGRAPLLPEIARSYGEMVDAAEGTARLEVESAREVDAEALKRIAAAWTTYSGAKTTRASVRLNPELIAGYRLKAGSLRIDYSVAGRLERLRRELARPLGSARGEG